MSQVQTESLKQSRRRRQARHRRLHPKSPARQRKLNQPEQPPAQVQVARPSTGLRNTAAHLPRVAPRLTSAGTTLATRQPAPVADGLSTPIEELELPIRAYNALKREGIHTVAQLKDKTEVELKDVRGLAQKGVDVIKQKLSGMGLALKA